ncbi:dTDP-4-amino-4,6-dideoxygalactose transaminase [Polynucleobacter paneuropaeus]|nr:dTDP-4-amino-4,6-dideoxygalactose transaminase [Polynucleobacter paneuropaeus]
MIPFNKPYLHGRELVYIAESVASGKISGDGLFTKKCHDFFEQRLGFTKALLTTSCTDALEMSSLLLNIAPGDEVIVPSFTFVSSANAFALRGAKIVFADSKVNHPNIDVELLETLITERTKAIVVVHYAGVACDMDAVMAIGKKYNLAVVEDAAQAIDSYYKGKPLGTIGQFGALSFHETKNITAGEGGLLAVNDVSLINRAEIIREKGTNRSAFFRGDVDKYGWVDLGSSFLPSDIVAAYLYAQLESLNVIQNCRKKIWARYHEAFSQELSGFGVQLPIIPEWATNNAHMYYLVVNNLEQRSELIDWLKENGIHATFHYLSLHSSPYFSKLHDGRDLPNSNRFSDCLIRLPLYFELSDLDQEKIIKTVINFFKK